MAPYTEGRVPLMRHGYLSGVAGKNKFPVFEYILNEIVAVLLIFFLIFGRAIFQWNDYWLWEWITSDNPNPYGTDEFGTWFFLILLLILVLSEIKSLWKAPLWGGMFTRARFEFDGEVFANAMRWKLLMVLPLLLLMFWIVPPDIHAKVLDSPFPALHLISAVYIITGVYLLWTLPITVADSE